MKKLTNFLLFIWPAILTFGVVWVLFSFVLVIAIVPTASMSPTIEPRSIVLGIRFWNNIERGDVVIFQGVDAYGNSMQYIKRVAGVGAETFEIRDGDIYSNGEKVEYPYRHTALDGDSFGPVEMPEDTYIMLGDNQDNSYDSRKWEEPLVHQNDITAKALFSFGGGNWKIF